MFLTSKHDITFLSYFHSTFQLVYEMLSHGEVVHLQVIAWLSNSYFDLLNWVIFKCLSRYHSKAVSYKYFSYFMKCSLMVKLYSCNWEMGSLTYSILNTFLKFQLQSQEKILMCELQFIGQLILDFVKGLVHFWGFCNSVQ